MRRGDPNLLDGGTGSELQRVGVNVSKGASVAGGLGAWSATAMEDAPEVVRQIHEDYLRVGADVITANSYNTNRGQLARVGLAHRMEDFSRQAVEIARDARDRVRPAAFVAGSIAPTTRFPGGWDSARVAPGDELRREWGDQVAVLARAGADLILIESMSAIFQALPALEAAAASGLPVWLGVHSTAAGTLSSGETMDALVSAIETAAGRVDAILLMYSPPEAISAGLPSLRAACAGPIGATPTSATGARARRRPRASRTQYHTLDVGENTPAHYAGYGRQWRAAGATIIGGCCATTPDHIAALRPVVKGVEGGL
jgi:S-methylmethionine-dependent homocysteine/selenocysteine methylase